VSRYTIEDLYDSTYHIKGPDGLVGALYFKGDPEAERFKRYIEAHDEVMGILRGVGKIYKRSELEATAEALIARIEGEEGR